MIKEQEWAALRALFERGMSKKAIERDREVLPTVKYCAIAIISFVDVSVIFIPFGAITRGGSFPLIACPSIVVVARGGNV